MKIELMSDSSCSRLQNNVNEFIKDKTGVKVSEFKEGQFYFSIQISYNGIKKGVKRDK